ncbi:MAG: STAS domain-containing protein [Armatimonadota bacterium]
MPQHEMPTALAYRDGATAFARLVGAVNRETIPHFEERVARLLRGGCRSLCLDLGPADYVDSDGIRWLMRLQARLAARGIGLRLAVREGCRAERTLRLVQLEGAFDIESYPADELDPAPADGETERAAADSAASAGRA